MRTATAAIALGSVLALAGCAAGAPGGAAGEHNDADSAFASSMVAHHEQALEMVALIEDEAGLDPEVAALAERIADAQGPEIAEMNAWLEEWGAGGGGHAGHGSSDGSGAAHEGMMSADDLAALDAASGEEAGRLFLEQMIEHHEGAVDAAEAHLDAGADPDALELARRIIDDQAAEIAEMRAMLD